MKNNKIQINLIIWETVAANQRKADNQWENRNFSLEKTIYGYPMREKKIGLGQKWKVSTVDIRIKKSGLKFIHSKVPSSVRKWIRHVKI